MASVRDPPCDQRESELAKRAHAMYEHVLDKVIKPLLGNKSTYLEELRGAGHKLLGVRFKGVFPSDRIPKLNDLAPYAILNLDRSGEPGSHWVAIAKNGSDTIFYDSFARDDKQIIPDLHFSGNGRIIDANEVADQQPTETNCGERCLAWLIIFDKYGYDVARHV